SISGREAYREQPSIQVPSTDGKVTAGGWDYVVTSASAGSIENPTDTFGQNTRKKFFETECGSLRSIIESVAGTPADTTSQGKGRCHSGSRAKAKLVSDGLSIPGIAQTDFLFPGIANRVQAGYDTGTIVRPSLSYAKNGPGQGFPPCLS
ncbi:MAG TPA: hypothetical protein PLF81_04930, partial [Candidatus Anammoximicrobium sp.]|nr:hypothetical protein [Candidatus Anammoximicrobium sp.]